MHRECGFAAVAVPIPVYRWDLIKKVKRGNAWRLSRQSRGWVETEPPVPRWHNQGADSLLFELGQLLFDEGDQLAHSLAVEDQPRACGAEQLRKRPGRAQGKRLAIFSDGFAAVAGAVAPNLKGAELCAPVFDVVERAAEEVRLLVPPRDAPRIEARPGDGRPLEA